MSVNPENESPPPDESGQTPFQPSISIGGNVNGPVVIGDGNQISSGSPSVQPAASQNSTPEGRLHLLAQMDNTFSQQDLAELCFGLEIDMDNLGAAGKRNQMRELILLLRRMDREPELLAACRAKRPHLTW